jgi:hypothetical protein
LFDAMEIAGGGRVVEIERGAAGEEKIADFVATGVDGHENGGDAVLIFGGSEERVGIEKRLDGGEIAGPDGFEEVVGGHGHLAQSGNSQEPADLKISHYRVQEPSGDGGPGRPRKKANPREK